MKRKSVAWVTGLIILCLFIFPQSMNATSWAYPFVVWDGYIYQVTDEAVGSVKDEIGEVTAYSDMDQLAGNFSNAYREGTKYYSIEGIDPSEAIAVEVSEDQYAKANRESEYQTKGINGDPGMFLSGLFLVCLLFFIGVTAYQFRKRLREKS